MTPIEAHCRAAQALEAAGYVRLWTAPNFDGLYGGLPPCDVPAWRVARYLDVRFYYVRPWLHACSQGGASSAETARVHEVARRLGEAAADALAATLRLGGSTAFLAALAAQEAR